MNFVIASIISILSYLVSRIEIHNVIGSTILFGNVLLTSLSIMYISWRQEKSSSIWLACGVICSYCVSTLIIGLIFDWRRSNDLKYYFDYRSNVYASLATFMVAVFVYFIFRLAIGRIVGHGKTPAERRT